MNKSSKKVLVIEDDPVSIRMFEKSLKNDGYIIFGAYNGEFYPNKVIYKDYANGEVLLIKEFDINIYERLNNINSLQEFLHEMIEESLNKIPLADLANFKIDVLSPKSELGLK